MPPGFQSAGNVAVGQLQQLPFSNIIGGPLVAAIEAQAKAAETTVDFIQAIGFDEVDGQRTAVNLTFSYEDATGAYRRVVVPLLSVIPIPFIVIDTVDIQFKARISASASNSRTSSKTTTESASASAKFRFWGQRLDISGSYSSKKDSKASQESKYSVEYTMDVGVHASQAGVPQGMAQILNILQDGITNKAADANVTIYNIEQLLLSSDANKPFNVLIVDANGQPVTGATIEVTSQLGLIDDASGVASSDSDGVYSVDMKPAATAGDLTADTNETLAIAVTYGPTGQEETVNLARLVTVRKA